MLGLLIALGVTEIAKEIDQLSRNMGGLSRSFSEALDNLVGRTEGFFAYLPVPFVEALRENQDKLFQVVRTGSLELHLFWGPSRIHAGLHAQRYLYVFISRDHPRFPRIF